MKTPQRIKAAVVFITLFLIIGICVTPVAYASAEPFTNFINNLVRTIQGIAATIAVLFIVFGAVKLKAAQGNPVAQQGAKSTIGLAIAGLLIAVFAYDIVRVITTAAGVSF